MRTLTKSRNGHKVNGNGKHAGNGNRKNGVVTAPRIRRPMIDDVDTLIDNSYAAMGTDLETIRVETPKGTAVAIEVGRVNGETRNPWRAGYHIDLAKLDHRGYHVGALAKGEAFSTRELAVRVTAEQRVRSILEGLRGDYKAGTAKRKLLERTIERVVKFIHHNPAADTAGRLDPIPGYRAPTWGQWVATLRGIARGIQFGHNFAADLDKRADAELDDMGRFFVAEFKAGKRPAEARDAWQASPLSRHFAPVTPTPTKAEPLLQFHPLSELLPPLSQADYNALRDDIRRTGKILRKGMLLEGKILDGRHRYTIGRELRIPIEFDTFDPAVNGDPAAWVLSQATGRQLATEQRPFVAVKFLGIFEATARERQRRAGGDSTDSASRKSAPSEKGKASEKAGEFWGCSPRSIEQAKFIQANAPDLFDLGFKGRTRGADGKLLPGINVSRALAEHKRREKIKKLDAAAAAARKHFHAIDAKRPFEIAHGDVIEEFSNTDLRPTLWATDPRYNMGFDYGMGAEADRTPEGEYLKWCSQWIQLGADLLADDGSMFVMIDVRHQDEILQRMKRAGLHHQTTIFWYEKFGSYNPKTFTPRMRLIHWCTKNVERFVFNGDLILIKSARELDYNDSRHVKSGMVPPNVWDDIPRLNDNDPERMPGFPTQVPLKLMTRIVRVASNPGDLVVDPFGGTFTTGEASILEGRRFFGTDIVKRNVEFGQKRLDVAFHQIGGGTNGKAKGDKR